jgi:hypothetical protein
VPPERREFLTAPVQAIGPLMPPPPPGRFTWTSGNVVRTGRIGDPLEGGRGSALEEGEVVCPLMTEVQRKLLASWQRAGYDGYGGWLGYKRNKTDAEVQEPA